VPDVAAAATSGLQLDMRMAQPVAVDSIQFPVFRGERNKTLAASNQLP